MDSNGDDEKKKSELAEGSSEQSDHPLPRFRIPTLRRTSPNLSIECSSSSGGSSSASASSSRRDSPPQRPESQRSSSTFIEQQPTMKSSQRSKTPAAETLQSWFSSTERQQEVNEGQSSARFQPPSLRRTDAAWQDRPDDPINSSGPNQPFSQGSSTISDSGEEDSLMWRPSFPALARTHSVLLQESEGPGPSSRQPPELLRLTHPFVRRDTEFWRLSTPQLPSFRDTPPLNTMNDPSVEPLEETLFSGLHSPSKNSSPSILDSNSLDENAKVKARAPLRTIPKTSGIDITNKWARKRATFRAPKKRIAAGHEELARQEPSIKRMKVDEESSAGDSTSDPPAELEVVPPPQLEGVPQQQQALEEFSITLTRLLNYSAPQRLRVWGAREEQTISQLISKKQAKSYGKKLAHLNNSYHNQDDPFLKAAVQRLAIFFEEAQTLYKGHYTQANLEEFQAQVEGAQLLENAIVMAKITGKSIKELCEETIENLSPARP